MKFLTDLISGILGFFGSLFKPKKENFFLEYEGDAAPASDSATARASTPADTVATSTDSAAAVAAVASETAAAIAPATATPAKSNKSARGEKKAPEAARAAAPVAIASTPTPSISFADISRDPCSGPSVSRRRPGANMAGFLAMAREVAVSR